ncbi:SCP-like protein [Ancylostoma ceylanicum]|uniref:SCP-like protein n=1 Tax=Ancylostoma ceylanicum TaxID=53326 RepID=A0A0D6MBF1_9BILA|nr:SCP-like protein [Ancylostoma ceylanicum]
MLHQQHAHLVVNIAPIMVDHGFFMPSVIASPKNDLLQEAVKNWYQSVVYYGQHNQDNKFTDPRLHTFANLAYSKNTAFGCHYTRCPDKAVVTCMYNNIVPNNAVIYEKGAACTNNQDCTTYPQSTCSNGLCVIPTLNPPNQPNPQNPQVTCPNAEMTDAARRKILDMHNSRRSALALGQIPNGKNLYNCPTATNMYKMAYDCALENSALAFAKQCRLAASAEGSRPGEGENIHWGALVTDQEKGAEAAVQAWWGQIYRNGLNKQMKYLISLATKPHGPRAFTQMAWANSVKLGCAVYNCQANTFTVCRYKSAVWKNNTKTINLRNYVGEEGSEDVEVAAEMGCKMTTTTAVRIS